MATCMKGNIFKSCRYYAFSKRYFTCLRALHTVRNTIGLEGNGVNPSDVQGASGENEFRRLDLYGRKQTVAKRRRQLVKPPVMPPRYTKMPVDQDWTDVWPTAHSFKPSVVPLPLHQGYHESVKVSPGKFGNAELMKVPNFLHLTPPAIKKHCAAIRKFCTPWPSELKTDENCEKYFPVTVQTNDYCHSGPSIRDTRARIVTIKIRLSNLNLDKHARDKLLRLVGDRYDVKTDILTITTDRCPLKRQNYDYAIYLLTVLYHESWKVEPWESEKEEYDMEEYVWKDSPSEESVFQLIQRMKKSSTTTDTSYLQFLPANFDKNDVAKLDGVKKYAEIVTHIHNHGEDVYALNKYKECVKEILQLP